jgi:DNA-binding LytR/AlgR family response regulator
MTILIVENEAFVVEDIKGMLEGLGYSKLYDTDTVDGALELVNKVLPDIVLVDIDLNGEKDGLELGDELNKKNIPFIYLSDLQDLNTFNRAKATNPQTNLAKPVNQLQLRNALLEIKTVEKTMAIEPAIWVTYKDKKVKINKADILYLNAAGNNCDIFLDKEKGYDVERYTSSSPMTRVLDTIDQSNFVQVHKSYCINIDKVEKYWGNRVILKGNDTEVPMTDTFKSNFTSKVKSV